MRKRPCLLFACIFLTGIVFQRYEWKILYFVIVCFLIMEVHYGIDGCFRKHSMQKRQDAGRNLSFKNLLHSYRHLGKIAGRSLLILSAFFLGMSHMKSEEAFRNTYMSNLEDGSSAVVWGEIERIEKTEYGNRLLLTDCYVSLSEAAIPCNKVMVYTSSDLFRVGQIQQIKGQLHFFERARNEGNFDALVFYQSQKIEFCLYESESILLDSNENAARDAVLALKIKLKEVYKNILEEDAAGFYIGMILGDKTLLSERTKDLFAAGGISHILAISGLHMSMIGRKCYQMLRKRRVGFLAAGVVAGILLMAYCYMTGSGTSAVRAVGMMLLYFLAQYWGRSYDMLNALGTVVVYLLWENPFLIEYSGFQFSIAALIGVGFVGSALSNGNSQSQDELLQNEKGEQKFNQTKKKGFLNKIVHRWCSNWISSLWMSMGITLSTLPIVAACYYEVPFYSPLVNSLVLPMLSPVFLLALIGALLGCAFPIVGSIVLMPCEWLFSFYEFVCEFVKELPFGCVITGMPKLEWIVIYYVVLLLGCLWIGRQNQLVLVETDVKQKEHGDFWVFMQSIAKKLVICVVLFMMIVWPKVSENEIIFLDVGQGDGIYIGAEDGTAYFIDGGSSDVKEVGTYRILPFLKAHGISRIDYWFVSHADSDHVSGLLEVMETGYEIGCIVLSNKMPEDEKKEELLLIAGKQEISVLYMKAGDQIASPYIRIGCLYPWAEADDKNEQSMVLQVDFFNESSNSTFRALFTGDISSEAERKLIKNRVLSDVDLYKAAHHGSKYSNSKELLEVIQPEYSVISCGKDNSYGHPHVDTIERLEDAGVEIYYIMESGQITCKEIDSGVCRILLRSKTLKMSDCTNAISLVK